MSALISGELLARPPITLYPTPSMPGTKKDFKFDKLMAQLDLEDGERYQFHRKTGGTSVGFKISRDGKRKAGLFMPPNSATNIEAEVVTYRLSRILGISRLSNPVDYYTLGPKAIAKFKRMLRRENQKWRNINTNATRRRMRRSPGALLGVYKFRPKRRTQSVNQLIRANGLNTSHRLAKFLRAYSPRPSSKRIALRRITADKPGWPDPMESEEVLARQLSNIFVLDLLTGQWDRFSGGNVEVIATKKGRLRFIGRDNGGAGLDRGWSWFNKYTRWVTRYDRNLVLKLKSLHEFFAGDIDNFAGFRSTKSLKSALGFRSDRSFKTFRDKLGHMVAQYLPKLESRYREQMYFEGDDVLNLVQQKYVVSEGTGARRTRIRRVANVANQKVAQRANSQHWKQKVLNGSDR